MKLSNLCTLLIAMAVLLTACSDDEKERVISEKDLPEMTLAFISRYLPDHTILKVEEITPEADEIDKYRIIFDNDLTIIFNYFGYWQHAEREDGLPDSLLEAIGSEEKELVDKHYPGQKVKGIHNNTEFRRVMDLMDDTRIVLYYIFGSTGVAKDLTKQPDLLPDKIKKFLSTYYPDATPDYVLNGVEMEERMVYKVRVRQMVTDSRMNLPPKSKDFEVTMEFEQDGELSYLQSGNYPIPDNLYESLPEKVKTYKDSRYPNDKVYEIYVYEDSYQLRLSENFGIIVYLEDPKPFRMDVVQEFIQEHFSPESPFLNMRFTCRLDNPSLYYGHVEYRNLYIKLIVNRDGIWQSIHVKDSFIPESIIDTLPAGIKSELQKRNSLFDVHKIVKEENGGYSLQTKTHSLVFDEYGNYRTS